MNTTDGVERWLDARGLACPLPLLKLKQELNRMKPTERIAVSTTDRGSLMDFEAFCLQGKHRIVHTGMETDQQTTVYQFLIEKCS